ncbi:putative ATP-dependent RNA helicase [Acanthamoeba castellanii mimivirus]|uniref:Putative ATP-dependent RNA helicase R290 n=5 Tax=Mimivirus TaxID=315393 RepID=YR290_MIMIV|nr:putative ATP-dependent RNA helicase [Acanthamoeba polyphaga mimivirus]Q5UPX0.1 RecName: Full=Putative ATP-dependent RNA helicase R290 [Acanthamoeba polyphaga mimivirus]AHJ40021.2 ATP-dependent RNA helicase [Samba virus]ALR83871.1 putative ATP-dependent RNA helicase [Niemeyer virus]AMZ02739.1 putative ATP-dependent RNA helicase [Mimivirus Bombay]BAV61389.1 putative ATP-dependent RNA helicase [Acanthamoeba castellanii mimivirus]AAV50562.1 unknown [Acanthamoeba polyphaga mimivirus]
MDDYEKSKVLTKRYKKLKKLLKMVYGYDNFRPRQYEIINKVINGEDVCAILMTSAGKSLCFQIPALYLDKPAIIISPLISLMEDQRLILEKLGISSCCYNSNVENKAQMRKDIMQFKYKFIYVSPESVVHLKDLIVKLEDFQGISLIAIDEAHCISAYGFDFRTAYREITFFKEILPNVPILALTATATNIVAKDICKVLQLKTNEPIKASFDRPNLYLEVRTKSKNPANDIVPIINKYPNQSVIIYCLTKKETQKIADILTVHKVVCGIYHAGLSNEHKTKTHTNFINNKIKIVVATIAFGMGINKPDVRVVIHYGAPKNIEGYYQEIGRAGRDGEKSYCYAFYNFQDFMIQRRFISQNNNPNYQKTQLALLEQMKKYVTLRTCRRKILLEYFDEETKEKCDFCDNCCGVHKNIVNENVTSKQNVQSEAKLIIELIESIPNRNFGVNMYINILRGSKNKAISPAIRKNKYYGLGSKHSSEWWKEVFDNLIKQGFLQSVSLKTGKFPIQVVKVTNKGVTWVSMADLGSLLDNIDNSVKLDPVEMVASV